MVRSQSVVKSHRSFQGEPPARWVCVRSLCSFVATLAGPIKSKTHQLK